MGTPAKAIAVTITSKRVAEAVVACAAERAQRLRLGLRRMSTQMAPAATIRVRAIAALTTSRNTAPRVAGNADEEEEFLLGVSTTLELASVPSGANHHVVLYSRSVQRFLPPQVQVGLFREQASYEGVAVVGFVHIVHYRS